MKHYLSFSSGIFLFAILILFACKPDVDEKTKSSKGKSKIEVEKNASKNSASGDIEGFKKIPLASKTTYFQIHRMNDIRGEGKLLDKGYRLNKGEDLLVIGYAIDIENNSPAARVLLELNGSDYIPTNYGGNSKAIANKLNNPKLDRSGFRITIPNEKFKKGKNSLRVVIIGKNNSNRYMPPRTYKVYK